ncbi:MAG: cytochrome c-type biogenesis protein CcmH [Bryobacteraceae bacterium]
MSKLSAAALLLAMGLSCLAQTPGIESNEVKRVGAHIACQCGSCKETVNCPMSMSGCGFCSPAKARIHKMQQAGMSDQSIIDTYIKQYGPGIYRGNPSSFYWIVPYSVLALGVLAIFWFVRRYYYHRPQVAEVSPPDESYSRYRDTIEKDLAKLE